MTRNKFLLTLLGMVGLCEVVPTWEERLDKLFSYGTLPSKRTGMFYRDNTLTSYVRDNTNNKRDSYRI